MLMCGGCCRQKLPDVASRKANPATPKTRRVIWFMSSSRILPVPLVTHRRTSSVTADGNIHRLQGSVRLLRCGENENLDPGLEVALVPRPRGNDRRVRKIGRAHV